jgi:hypothetical protein
VVQLHTGSANAALARPSWGAWLLYGLGTENQSLPGYITINPMFLAGAGVKKGFSYGATDEIGPAAIDRRMHTNDLHATLLGLMGIDHERLTYHYEGRAFRLTNVAGLVQRDIFA